MLKQHLEPIEKRGVLETLRRIISRLNEIFRYAATEELIEFNPADNLGQRFSKPKTEYASITPSELPRFLVALNNASIRLETRLLIEWQLLTWVRPVKLFAQDGQILILKLACGTSRRSL